MDSTNVVGELTSDVLDNMTKITEEVSKKTKDPEEEEYSHELPTGLEVTLPSGEVDGALIKKRNLVGCLIVLAACIIFPAVGMFPQMMQAVSVQTTQNASINKEIDQPEYVDTYNVIYGLFGIISGILITVFNYRPVAAAGAMLSGLGCLVASFLNPENEHAMAFVYGFLPGVGNNFLYTAAFVAILECFLDKKLLIVILTFLLDTVVQMIIFSVINLASTSVTSWRVILGIMCGIYGLCLVASYALVPLNFYMKDNPRQSLRSRIMNTEGLHIFKSPLLYAMGGVFFFTGIGQGIPTTLVWKWEALLLVVLLAASLVALITSCCCFRKFSRKTSLVVVTVLGFLMGTLSLSVEGFDIKWYAYIYSAVYGLGYGVREAVMRNMIPLVMGEKYLGLTIGFLTFGHGIGSIIGEKSSQAILDDLNQPGAPFYLSGVAMIISSVMAIFVLKLVISSTRKVSQSKKDEDIEKGKPDPTTEVTDIPNTSRDVKEGVEKIKPLQTKKATSLPRKPNHVEESVEEVKQPSTRDGVARKSRDVEEDVEKVRQPSMTQAIAVQDASSRSAS